MLKLIIEDDEGRRTVVPFVREEITIGRQEGNTIRLTERNVSRRHARLYRQNGKVIVEDLGSYNGVKVNGERIQKQRPLRDGDLVQIGDYDLAILAEAQNGVSPAPSPTLPRVPTIDALLNPDDIEEVSETDPTQVGPDQVPVVAAAPAASPSVPLAVAEPPVTDITNAPKVSTAVIRKDKVESSTHQVVELAPEQAPRLVVLNSEFAGREFACIRSELRIGRASENDIALDHRSLSRIHAKLVREEDGEWRVLDLDSANGLTVNGESYAASSLKNGDVLELGHLKLKFLGAGEAFRFVPESDDVAVVQRSSRPVIAGLFLGFTAVAAVGVYVLVPPADLAHLSQQVLERGRALAARLPSAIGGGTTEEAAPADSVDGQTDPAALDAQARGVDDADLDPQATLASAREALNAEQFQTAVAKLTQLKKAGLAPEVAEEVESLLALALNAGQGQGAQESTPVASAQMVAEAQRVFKEGMALFQKKQLRQAQGDFNRCLEMDPSFAHCHLMLGVTHAKLNDIEAGARHYRLFVKLAPDAPEAPKVRTMLEQYEASQKSKQD